MKNQGGYLVTVEGQYFVSEGDRGKGLKHYKFDFKLPTMDCALSIIKNKVLDLVLSKKYKDYVSYRTYNIINVKPFGGARMNAGFDLWSSSREEVEDYLKEKEIPVKLKLYPSLMDLRQAVMLAESDLDRFLINQTKLEEDFIFTESLRDLNPGVYASVEEPQAQQEPDKDLLESL